MNSPKHPSTPSASNPELTKKKKHERINHPSLTEQEQKNLKGLIEAIESTGLDEFMEYIRSPWKMLWPNFIAGVARGVGALVGAALVIALIGWILSKLISLPLIGQSLEPYIRDIQTEVNKYTEATNYKDEFREMRDLLREINQTLSEQPKPTAPIAPESISSAE